MESVVFYTLLHAPGCSKCGRPYKGHPLPYGTNCALALAEECTAESRDIPACVGEGSAANILPGLSTPGEPPAVDNVVPVLAEQCLKPPDRTAQQQPA